MNKHNVKAFMAGVYTDMNAQPDELYVDGLDQPGGLEGDGCFAGDGPYPPFVIFNATKQKNLPGYHDTRELAEAHLATIEKGR